jgi:hypothetical protein
VERKEEIKKKKGKRNEGRKQNYLIHLHMQLAEKKAGRKESRQAGRMEGRKTGRKEGRQERRQAGRKDGESTEKQKV